MTSHIMNESNSMSENLSQYDEIISILDGTTKVDSNNYSMINRVLLCFDVGKLKKTLN